MILAVLNKPNGRGHLRCWRAFLFDTDIQSEVEQFMMCIHREDYFLTDPDGLSKDEIGQHSLDGLWVMETIVCIKTKGKHTTFTIKV